MGQTQEDQRFLGDSPGLPVTGTALPTEESTSLSFKPLPLPWLTQGAIKSDSLLKSSMHILKYSSVQPSNPLISLHRTSFSFIL